MAQVSRTTYDGVKEAASEVDEVRKALKKLRRSYAWYFWAAVILAILPLLVPLGKPGVLLIVGYMGLAAVLTGRGICWAIEAFRIARPTKRTN